MQPLLTLLINFVLLHPPLSCPSSPPPPVRPLHKQVWLNWGIKIASKSSYLILKTLRQVCLFCPGLKMLTYRYCFPPPIFAMMTKEYAGEKNTHTYTYTHTDRRAFSPPSIPLSAITSRYFQNYWYKILPWTPKNQIKGEDKYGLFTKIHWFRGSVFSCFLSHGKLLPQSVEWMDAWLSDLRWHDRVIWDDR